MRTNHPVTGHVVVLALAVILSIGISFASFKHLQYTEAYPKSLTLLTPLDVYEAYADLPGQPPGLAFNTFNYLGNVKLLGVVLEKLFPFNSSQLTLMNWSGPQVSKIQPSDITNEKHGCLLRSTQVNKPSFPGWSS